MRNGVALMVEIFCHVIFSFLFYNFLRYLWLVFIGALSFSESKKHWYSWDFLPQLAVVYPSVAIFSGRNGAHY